MIDSWLTIVAHLQVQVDAVVTVIIPFWPGASRPMPATPPRCRGGHARRAAAHLRGISAQAAVSGPPSCGAAASESFRTCGWATSKGRPRACAFGESAAAGTQPSRGSLRPPKSSPRSQGLGGLRADSLPANSEALQEWRLAQTLSRGV